MRLAPTRRQALAGAAALASLPAAAQGPVTLRMWTFLDPAKSSGREVALREMIAGFERAHPGVRIRVEPQIFSELTPKFLAAHATGNAPDITWVNTEQMGALVRSGAAADLNALILNSWPAGAADDFFVRAGWDAGLAGGKRHAVPLFLATLIIFYRRDRLEAVGIAPDSLRTWDDLAAAAKRLTEMRDGRADVWGFGTPLSTERAGGTTAFTTMLQSAGPIWDEKCGPHYATPVGERAVRWHVDLIRNGAMPRDTVAYNVDDIADQFVAGRSAMAVMPIQRVGQVRSGARWDPGRNLAVLPWPNWTVDEPGPQLVDGWYAAVWSRSRHLNEAAAFVEQMIAPEAVQAWTSTGQQLPTRLSVWQRPEFRAPDYDLMRVIVERWRDSSFALPIACNTVRYDSEWNQSVQRVLAGGAPLAALAEAERAFTARQQ